MGDDSQVDSAPSRDIIKKEYKIMLLLSDGCLSWILL